MKQFKKLSMVLFDSTNAAFKLSVEATFTKINNMGGFSPLVYVTNSGSANLNPNIYLLFSFKSETFDKGNMLYTSYPQLFRIREAMTSIKDLIADGRGFSEIDDNGAKKIVVKQEYTAPVVLTNIGKQNKWLSFKLAVVSTTEEGVTTYMPGVSIEISSANGNVSMLSVEEFLTIYSIVMSLDLTSLQCSMSLAFLNAEDSVPMAPQQQMYQPQQYHQGNYQQQRQPYVSPRYNQQQRPAPAARKPFQGATQYQQPTKPSQPHGLNPREETPVMTLDSVAETPVSEISYDDDSAINEIFGEN